MVGRLCGGQPAVRRAHRRGRVERPRLGARLPAPAGAGDAARAAPRPRIGFFLHIPFPPAELFLPAPMARHILRGSARCRPGGVPATGCGGELRPAGARPARLKTHRDRIVLADGRACARPRYPISSTCRSSTTGPRPPRRRPRRRDPRGVGRPATLLLGVDRLDYTKGIRQRLRAFGELLGDGRSRSTKPCSSRWRRRAASGSRSTACSATTSTGWSAGSTATTDGSASRRPLHAPVLPARGDGRAVPGGGRHGGHAARRRHEPGREGVRRLPVRRHRRAGAVASSPALPTS